MWYKKSNGKKEKRPYKIIQTCWGQERDTGINIEAFSREQARRFALQRHSKLRDLLQIGCSIEARLNKEEWDRRQRVEQMEKERMEKFIQDAWWQD
jgi:hypothetical protein